MENPFQDDAPAVPAGGTEPAQNLVRWIVSLVLLFTTLALVCAPLFGPPRSFGLVMAGFGPFIVMYLIALWLNGRGRTVLAANIYLWGTYSAQLFVVFGVEAYKTQALLSFVNLVLCAGYMKGRISALRMGTACLGAVLVSHLLGPFGFLQGSLNVTPQWVFLSVLSTLATTCGLVYIGTRFTTEAIDRATISQARAEEAAAQLAAAASADAARVMRAERLVSMARRVVALRELPEIAHEVATALSESIKGAECVVLDSRGGVLSVSGAPLGGVEPRLEWAVAEADVTRPLSTAERTLLAEALGCMASEAGQLFTSREGTVSMVLLGSREQLEDIDKDLQFNTAWHVLSTGVHRIHVEHALGQSHRMDALGRLSAGITHDFNNLLTSILGGAELAANQVQGDPVAEKYISGLQEAAERAAGLTGKLLAFSASASEGPVNVEVVGLVERLLPLLRGSESERINLDVALPDQQLWIQADPVDFERAILNLVVNAQAAIDDEGTIEIGVERREPQSPDAQGQVVVWVQDSGAGIPPELHGKVFEPFFSTRRDRGASGLGLSIVYGVVQAMGGDLLLSSEVGIGTRIEILLTEQPGGVMEPQETMAVEASTVERRILVVEDDPAVRETVSEMLGVGGYTVCTAEDGEAALKALASGPSFSLVLSDVLMPKMDGFELVRKIRTQAKAPPVALVSGYAPTVQSEAEPAIPMITKPFTLKRLLEFVDQLIEERERA